jgi:hypothetical protein
VVEKALFKSVSCNCTILNCIVIKGEANGLLNKIDNQFDFIQDEIETHIESLKAKLDEINEQFKTKLNIQKNEIKE